MKNKKRLIWFIFRDLKTMCETALCDNINTENVLGEYYLYKSVATPWY